MNNRTEIERKMYEEANKGRKNFILNKQQINNLNTMVKSLNDYTAKYIEMTKNATCNGYSLIDGFSSDECKKAIKNGYKDFYKIKKKCKNYVEHCVNECQFSLLQELEYNTNLLQDRLKIVQKEQNSLLRKLKSYEPTMDICENISFISFYYVDIPYLISLTRKYFYKNKIPHFYNVMFKLGKGLYEKAQEIVDIYAEWEEESERGC